MSPRERASKEDVVAALKRAGTRSPETGVLDIERAYDIQDGVGWKLAGVLAKACLDSAHDHGVVMVMPQKEWDELYASIRGSIFLGFATGIDVAKNR